MSGMLETRVGSPQVEAFTIAFEGDLTIRGVAAAHGQMVEALAASGEVIAQIDPEASVDLTFVQLMESARRAASEAGGALDLAQPATGGLLETLQRGGFLADPERRQFWLKTSEDQ